MADFVLRDLIEASLDGEWGKGEPSAKHQPMLCIRGTDFAAARVGSLASVPLRHIEQKHADRKTLRPWDLLLEVAGGTKDQITGRSLLLRPRIFDETPTAVTCASFSRFIRLRRELCDPEFVFWYLQYLYASGAMHAYHTQHTGVARFQWTTFADREPFRLPSLPEQQRIAGVLSPYDDLIENCERRIRILDDMARALFREWFVLFHYPGHENVPLVPSALGKIPRHWCVEAVDTIAMEVRRGVPKGAMADSVPYVGLEHIPRRSLALDAWEETNELGSSKLRFKSGEVLFGKIRPYFHKVAVAAFEGVCSADTFVISARDPSFYGFMVGLVSSDAFVAHATATSNGAKMPRANWKVMSALELAIPPESVAAQFNDHFRPVLAAQANLVSRCVSLRKARDILLKRLLSHHLGLGGEE